MRVSTIPEQVTAALRAWHAAAVEFDPNYPSDAASERARQAWLFFEDQCLKWEREERARRHLGVAP